MMEALFASVFVLKYGGIVVLSDMRGETLYPLLLERLGIHSDPMKPLMAPVGIHEVGEPDEDSPVVLTSSWALTYLLLRAAVEASGVPAWICVAPVEEETDVLCWCPRCLRSNHPGRLEHAATREFLEGCGIRERVRHTTLLISGRSTQERDDLERALPGWEVAVGPADADGLAGWLGGRARESAG